MIKPTLSLLATLWYCCTLSTAFASPLETPGILQQIQQLGHTHADIRFRAHRALYQTLVLDTDHPDYFNRVTLFYKQAPHICRKENNKLQTLHVLHLFAAQEDISNVFLEQCLKSRYISVQKTALQFSIHSDNSLTKALQSYTPSPETLRDYKLALRAHSQ